MGHDIPTLIEDHRVTSCNTIPMMMTGTRWPDPGWFQHPEGHRASEYAGELPEVSEGPGSQFWETSCLLLSREQLLGLYFLCPAGVTFFAYLLMAVT